jgi:CRISPR system Cascade subunit CasD
MQSWGTASRFELRDTQLEPSKSGVVGLVGSAMGIGRDDRDAIARLAALQMAVRVDRQGEVRHDKYQTAGGGTWPGRKRYGVYKASGTASSDATLSTRYYLADASFLVAVGGEDHELVDAVDAAVRDPRYPLWLGRKGYAPSSIIARGVVEADPETALRSDPALPEGQQRDRWLVVECGSNDGEARRDVPIVFTPDAREFGLRYVRRIPLDGSGGASNVAQ